MRATSVRAADVGEIQVGSYFPSILPPSGIEGTLGITGAQGALWRAVRRAAAAIRNVPVDVECPSDLLPEDRGAAVDAICVAWCRAYFDGRPDIRGESLPERATLDKLRVAFLDQVAAMHDRPDLNEVLRMLSALEAVRERLDVDEAQRFRRSFGGLTAMDLVVEVSHDMRSPLTAILLLTDTLRRTEASPAAPTARRQLGLIYSAAFGLHAMLNDVIELARGGDRLFDPEPVSFSVGEVIREVEDIVRPLAEERGLELRIEGPKVDSRTGHPLALSRVLLNLTSNALKFTREGSVTIRARERSRTSMEFAVIDTGVGIPADVMGSLFEPFRRLRRGASLGSSFSSAGLGLAISRRLVRSMGSELRVTSDPGSGTQFSFEVALPTARQGL